MYRMSRMSRIPRGGRGQVNDIAHLVALDPIPKSTADIRSATGWSVQRAARAATELATSTKEQ